MSVCASARLGGAASVLVIACWVGSARAQPPVTVWEPASASEVRAVDPEYEPAVVRRTVPRRGLLGTGVVVSALAFTASAVWGAYFLGDLQLGVPSCNDQYGAWHFAPLVGPVIGAVTADACVPDQLHFEEILMPAIFSAGQLAGLILFAIGAAGHEVDVPNVALTASADGALVRVGGTF